MLAVVKQIDFYKNNKGKDKYIILAIGSIIGLPGNEYSDLSSFLNLVYFFPIIIVIERKTEYGFKDIIKKYEVIET